MKSRNSFEEYSFKRIRRVVHHARKAPFWRRKLPGDIRSMEEFRHIPITTRKEITELCDAGRWVELLTTSPKKSHIIVTSGGRPYQPPFTSCFSKKEFEKMSQSITNMILRSGVKKGRILITFPGVMPFPSDFAKKILPRSNLEEYQSSHISGALFKHASICSNIQTFCTGLRFLAYKVSKEEAIIERKRIMRAYSFVRPEMLATSPNVLRNVFFPELERRKHSFSDYNTELVISGGSQLLKEDYERIRSFGNPKIIVWIESGEVGTIGYSSEFWPDHFGRQFYYTTWRQNLFETISNEGYPLPFGSRGRIVVTRLNTFVQPLIRYDLEDEGAFFILGNEIVLGNDILKL